MGAKVLLAHGDTHQLEVAVQALTTEGFEVVATPDGGDAFARFFEESPDVVVASLALPVLDGRGFASMIKSQTPEMPVVLLTNEVPTEPDPSGVLFLPEPLDVDLLRQLVPSLGERAPAGGPESLAPEADRELLDTLVSFQRQGNILSLLDAKGLERLAAIAAIQDRGAGELVIREGDPCDGFYLVVIGAVRVTLAERGDQEVARLGPGEFFGEMALLSEQPRSASVWTCDPSKLFFFEREAVLELLHDYPEMRELLGGVALQRAEENLWQALSSDGEVQRNLSVLLDGLEDERDAAKVDASPGPAVVATVPPTPTALEPETGMPAGAGGPLPPPVPPGAEAPAEDRGYDEVEVSSPAVGSVANLVRAVRLYASRHQFGVGLGVGAVVGVVAMVAILALVVRGTDGEPVPVVPRDREGLGGQNGAERPAEGDRAGADGGRTTAADRGEEGGGRTTEAGRDGEGGGRTTAAGRGKEAERGGESGRTADRGAGGERAAGAAEGAGGEVAAAAAAAYADRPVPPRPGLARLGRKVLRKALMAAYDQDRFEDALACGLELERRFTLDWESEFKTAEAAHRTGRPGKALELYGAFADKYPTNVYADDALFFSAELLTGQGALTEARALFERVAADPESNLRKKAARRAAELAD